MRELPGAEAGWIERESPSDGCTLALMTVFGIADVRAFAAAKSRGDLKFRAVHEAGGIGFANARDPAGDSIQMSGGGIARRRRYPAASILSPEAGPGSLPECH